MNKSLKPVVKIVPRQKILLKIVNIVSFDETEAYGFYPDLTPCTDERSLSKCKYRFTGSWMGTINLRSQTDKQRFDVDRERNQLAEKISENLGINDPEGVKLYFNVLKGVDAIRIYQKYQEYGMFAPYVKGSDEWVLSGSSPDINYDKWNELLKEIGSEWRIATVEMEKFLLRLQAKKLLKESDNV